MRRNDGWLFDRSGVRSRQLGWRTVSIDLALSVTGTRAHWRSSVRPNRRLASFHRWKCVIGQPIIGLDAAKEIAPKACTDLSIDYCFIRINLSLSWPRLPHPIVRSLRWFSRFEMQLWECNRPADNWTGPKPNKWPNEYNNLWPFIIWSTKWVIQRIWMFRMIGSMRPASLVRVRSATLCTKCMAPKVSLCLFIQLVANESFVVAFLFFHIRAKRVNQISPEMNKSLRHAFELLRNKIRHRQSIRDRLWWRDGWQEWIVLGVLCVRALAPRPRRLISINSSMSRAAGVVAITCAWCDTKRFRLSEDESLDTITIIPNERSLPKLNQAHDSIGRCFQGVSIKRRPAENNCPLFFTLNFLFCFFLERFFIEIFPGRGAISSNFFVISCARLRSKHHSELNRNGKFVNAKKITPFIIIVVFHNVHLRAIRYS